jgi:hypothetical protein
VSKKNNIREAKSQRPRNPEHFFSFFSCLSLCRPSHRFFFSFFFFHQHTMIPISSLTPLNAIPEFCTQLHEDCEGEAGCRKTPRPLTK